MQTILENRYLIGSANPRLALLLLVPLLAVVSCQSNPSTTTQQEKGRALFGTKAADQGEGWSIVIVTYATTPTTTEREVRDLAQLDLKRVQDVGLREAYVQFRGKRLVLAYGSYPAPNDPTALADLDRVKAIEWQGINPFAGALLSPPQGIDVGSHPEYNLINVKQRFGPKAIYSLLIGEYGHPDKATPTESERRQFRQAAEDGVAQLRREGEAAFYYHSPRSSSITVGVFGHDDYRIEIDENRRKKTIRSSRLNATQSRFQNFLLNGKTVRLPALSRGGIDVYQGTDLIEIPR